jgi:hypothetical protein
MPGVEVEFEKQMSLRGLNDENSVSTGEGTTDLQGLKEIIRTWREMNSEVSELSAMLREKKKRQKALEEVILRTMKKNTIGALDLTGSGGRIIYRRHTTKGTLNLKSLSDMLTKHLKSDKAAEDALKYINENREGKVRESLLYEKE